MVLHQSILKLTTSTRLYVHNQNGVAHIELDFRGKLAAVLGQGKEL